MVNQVTLSIFKDAELFNVSREVRVRQNSTVRRDLMFRVGINRSVMIFKNHPSGVNGEIGLVEGVESCVEQMKCREVQFSSCWFERYMSFWSPDSTSVKYSTANHIGVSYEKKTKRIADVNLHMLSHITKRKAKL
ncbi:hypothetical protein CAEBREN_04144 [Caenorhabditis brenneri]|uniref:Uncharacterized protein n=1 Tax=Caenorhabditis brenneri TaxID=135651 RepID=G0N1J7_CAEBE|nr:hypothetical protein CAEBREN_04144 [Caenorhabditis brenneri]